MGGCTFPVTLCIKHCHPHPLFTECVFTNDVLWEEFEFHPEVLVVIHGRQEVEVLDVDGHELCIGHGDDSVE